MIALRLLLVVILFLNAGCASPNPGPCPPLKAYTAAENEQLASELEQLSPQSITVQVVADYIELRDQLRACQ